MFCATTPSVHVVLGEVTGIDPVARTVATTELSGRNVAIGYDSLIVAAGAVTSYYGHDEFRQSASGMKIAQRCAVSAGTDLRCVRTGRSQRTTRTAGGPS